MEAYSLDLRERVARACDEEQETRQDTAERFGVSESFIRKLLRRRRDSGSLAPLPHGGGRRPALDERGRAVLRELVDRQPDATLEQLKTRLQMRTGKAISKSAVDRHLRTLDLPRKKSRCTPASGARRGCRSCGESSASGLGRLRPRS